MGTCPGCAADVREGDAICVRCGAAIDGATESFAPVGGPEYEAPQPTGSGDRAPVLVVGRGAETGERFYLEDGVLTVGRDPSRDIFLNDVTVSREHAVLHIVGGAVTVEDSGSLNGTYVNGVRVDSAPLRNGDALQVGRFRMVFLSGGEA